MRPVGSKYLLEEPLGRGATGTVWRARVREGDAGATGAADATHRGEAVAIKVLREELAADPDVVMRFLRERSVLLRLTHPNIVKVRDLVVEGDLLALVMTLVEGPDLHRYLRENGPFSPVAASLLTAQIADALAASHDDHVVHRDLKPANVLLLTDDGDGGAPLMRPLLTDFGIARLADSPRITRTSEFSGTPAYVAPESAQGLAQTSAVDVYGAGIILYELLTGRPPFYGDNSVAVLHQHISDEPRRPSSAPDPLWTVIERCLRKNPDERPSARSLARGLRVVADGIGVHATPAGVEAALAVAGLLVPDSSPSLVPGTGDPAAATQVLPVGGARPGATSGAPDPTRVLSPMGGDDHSGDATVTGPVARPPEDGASGGAARPEDPHPWQTQLRAARSRNEQTQIQPLDPSEDPLRRRARRQAPPPAVPPPAPYPDPRQQPYQQPYQQRGPAPAPYPVQPSTPQRPVGPTAPPPEPSRPRREPRQRTPMRIPGLGCLKGCLTMIVLVVVVVWLAWNFGPLQDWVANGKSFWDTVSEWWDDTWSWLRDITGAANNG